MKITFPHMGNIAISLGGLLTTLGLEVIPPPPITKRTMELGTKHSPESICLPFKVNIGNYIEAIELGADTIIMAGGVGPCRFGYYAYVQHDILKDLGYEVSLWVLEPSGFGKEFRKNILETPVLRSTSKWELLRQIHLAARKAYVLDDIETKVLQLRSRERNQGDCDRVLAQCKEDIFRVRNLADLKVFRHEAICQLHQVPLQINRETVRVGLVGEIYMLLEPNANLNIEKKLGSLGAEVHRTMFMGEWLKHHVLHDWAAGRRHKRIVKAAAPYLEYRVGGHGLESVGTSALYAQQGRMDGLIHVLPLTCMPEIVAQSILPAVSKDWGLPIMSLVLDEHSGEAGIQTRLEAFVDMLKLKKFANNEKVVNR